MKKLPLLMSAGLLALCVGALGSSAAEEAAEQPGWVIEKNGVEVDMRSFGRQMADDMLANDGLISADAIELKAPRPTFDLTPPAARHHRRGNVQANDGTRDFVQTIDPFRPFVNFTQSETSIAVHGRDIVAGYNDSAGQVLEPVPPDSLRFTQRFLSGFATSNDGGRTWVSGSIPPTPGSATTLGDPSVDVDRRGDFYYATFALNADNEVIVQVNKSLDGGRTWSPGIVVQQDDFADKEWIAVGKDPFVRSRDNVYVTWTSLRNSPGNQLRFARSIDGGETWEAKTIFQGMSDPVPENPQRDVRFSNPYVDQITGALYVPFLHMGNRDKDYIRILISDDAGETFRLATFNIPDAPDPNLLPIVTPGTLADCGDNGGRRPVIHTGPDIGGRFGILPSYVQASRLIVQPALAARDGVVYLAWSASTSETFGDPESGANIFFMRSDDGGQTWTDPVQVNPTIGDNKRHVLPALTIGENPNDVYIAYYTQHADGTVDVDLASSHNRGATFPERRVRRISNESTTLPPTNTPLSPPDGPRYNTVNYDRLLRPCYSLGEYLSVREKNGVVHVLWANSRNSVTHPVNPLDPFSGQTHPQQDVLYQRVKRRKKR